MVELKHEKIPLELFEFIQKNPNAGIDEFNSPVFTPIKHAIKTVLNELQNGLCVYCEQKLSPDKGQLEHIKPKSKNPDLCFEYTNYAHSCCNNKTCGQKKKSGLLPIEPRKECNKEWFITVSGELSPVQGLNKQRRHQVIQTRDMLGLNDDSLIEKRFEDIEVIKSIFKNCPEEDPQKLLHDYLQTQPFRYILKTYFD